MRLLSSILLVLYTGRTVLSLSVPRRPQQLRQVTIQMEGYSPDIDDDYVAISMPIEPGYIVRFEPFAQADRIHHMLLYGCDYPAMDTKFWKGGQTCRGAAHILYAWARNAPDLRLPAGVAFGVGHEGDSMRYLVLQVHYAHPFAGKLTDYSGVTVHMMDDRPQYLAAVLLFVSGQPIPPGYAHHQNNVSCVYSGNTPLHPFAFRTHTHGMGRVVSAFYKHNEAWTMIGKRNPQWPQLFQSITSNLTIAPGDLMASTCVFDSSQTKKTVNMGNTGNDEMCNFYMMFYWDSTVPDPYPYGAACAMQDQVQTVRNEYPAEGVSPLPSHPEWEHQAHQSGDPFGFTDGIFAKSIGDIKLGQIAGLAFDQSGNLVIFHRGPRFWDQGTFDYANTLQDRSTIPESTVLVVKPDANGKSFTLLAKYGQNQFYLPHGIFVDRNGDYYTTDVGSHQVIKWRLSNQKLEKVMALGEQFVPGADHDHFCMPAAVTVIEDGSIFIADGYCNSRVMKFNAQGKFLTKWGEPYFSGNLAGPPALGMFNLVHDITTNVDGSLLYVSDRENARVQIFRTNGQPVGQIGNPGNKTLFSTVYSAHYQDGSVYLVPGEARLDVPLRVFSAHAESARIQFSFEPTSSHLQRPHVIRASPDGQYIYVADLGDDLGGQLLQFNYQRPPASNAPTIASARKPSSAAGMAFAPSLTQAGAKTNVTATYIVIVLFAGTVIMGLAILLRRRRAHRTGKPQSILDRAGFKPLRTDDPETSDEDSDDDTIISRGKFGNRF